MSYRIFGRKFDESYDAVVVGSGVGGLVCANLLADGGLKVLLLERHWMLGGFCSTFRRRGFVFDAATHFYPLLGNPATLTGKIIKQLEIPTEWIKMDPVDRFHVPGLAPFDVPADYDQYLAKLKSLFPEERQSIDDYFGELRQTYLYGLLHYFRGVTDRRTEEFSRLTVDDKVKQHFRDPRLRTLLVADCSHWGSVPGRTSYLFDAMLRLSYFLGNYYPKGSSQRFADDLGAALAKRGGRFLRCAKVEEIVVENGAARGVRIRTVSNRKSETFTFRAGVVVSNADMRHTFRDLLGNTRPEVDQHLEGFKPSSACSVMHLGLRGVNQKDLNKIEGYYWNDHDPDAVLRSVFKIFTTTRFDPDLAPPGGRILIVQKVTPQKVEPGVDWGAAKAEFDSYIMGRLRDLLPGIDDHIVVRQSATARTSHHFTGNTDGAMLGWEMSPEQLGVARLPNSSSIGNLYFVGHWTRPGGGVTPVMIGAQRVAREILTGRGTIQNEAAEFFTSLRPSRTERRTPVG